MDLMKAMARAMKTMGAMAKGEAPFDPAKLAEMAGADEAAMRPQILKVGKTCGTCHDRFRKPKD